MGGVRKWTVGQKIGVVTQLTFPVMVFIVYS